MHKKLALAIQNNAEWCNLVCSLNNAPGTFETHIWATQKEVPLLYPCYITLESIANNYSALEKLYTAIKEDKRKNVVVKDSFNELDLKDLKCDKIVDAEWIVYDQGRIEFSNSSFQRIHFPIRFEKWLKAWNRSNKTNLDIFPSKILKDDTVWVCGEYQNGEFTKGAILYSNDRTVGITNIFSEEENKDAFWKELLAFISVQFPAKLVVGYETGESLASAIAAGFEPVGHLAVWKK